MFNYKPHMSGSAGNLHYIDDGNSKLFLDCGLEMNKLNKTTLISRGIMPSEIDMILITHEHQDHIAGVEYFKNKKTKILISGKLKHLEQLQGFNNIVWLEEVEGKEGHMEALTYKGWTILPFKTFHNTIDPLGFYGKNNQGDDFLYITDTGKPPADIKNPTLMIIEASYCQETINHLMNLDPKYVAKFGRIASDVGHLSYQKAFEYAEKNSGDKTELVIYAHLSKGSLENIEKIFKGREYIYPNKICYKEFKIGKKVEKPIWMRRK